MGDKLKVVECLDMKHGWTTRGDISDPNIKRYTTLLAGKGGGCQVDPLLYNLLMKIKLVGKGVRRVEVTAQKNFLARKEDSL